MRIALAQFNPLVGDVRANALVIRALAEQARDELKADVVVLPELALTGFPAADLLLRAELHKQIAVVLEEIIQHISGIVLVFGLPRQTARGLCNAALVWCDGKELACYHKRQLASQAMFDEPRYFIAGDEPCICKTNGVSFGIVLGDEGVNPTMFEQAKAAGAQIMLNLAAMPFHAESEQEHEAAARVCVMATAMPLVFVNQLGGQDELVFAGQSMAMAASGELCVRPPAWQAGLWLTEFVQTDNTWQPLPGLIAAIQSFEAGVYAALVCGLRDYMAKNNFQDVVLGLSGGIDSALVLAIAVDALGAERVEAVMMPSRYTAEMSLADAKEQAETLGVAYREIPIEPLFQAFLTSLQDVFAASAPDITEENLQTRCRGVLLMAIANKKHKVVLIASNKSELAVGYTTLYGDMAGGFAVLKDVPKTLVYRLVKYRNSIGAAIPQRVIDRPPSAELAPDQQDTDSLPDYEILDDILQRYVVLEQDGQTIVAAGHYVSTVQRVMQLVESNEYKRQQAAPGVRISRRAFGRERRYPITSGFKNIVNFQHRK